MGRYSASASLRETAWRAALLTGALLAAAAAPAAAQQSTPDVVVNESVIDALGPPQTAPGLLGSQNSGTAELRPVTLHPPKTQSTAETQKPKPATERQAASTAPERSHAAAKAKPEPAAKPTTKLAAAPRVKPPKQTAGKPSPSQPLQRASLASTTPRRLKPSSSGPCAILRLSRSAPVVRLPRR